MVRPSNTARVQTGLAGTLEQLAHLPADELAKLQEVIAKLPTSGPVAPDAAAVTAAVNAAAKPQTQEQSHMSNTSTIAASPSAISNKPNFVDVLKDIQALGETEAKGKDGWVQCLLKIVDAAFTGAIDLTANKHGNDLDDAQKLANAYTSAAREVGIFDRKPPAVKKCASCIRTMVRLGMWPKGGPSQPLEAVNTFMTIYRRMRTDPAHAKRMIDAANALLTFARTQIKRDSVIDEDEMRGFMLRKEPDPKEEEDWLELIRRKALNAKTGKGGVAVDVATAEKIERACTSRLKEIAKARGAQPADASSGALATATTSPVPVQVTAPSDAAA